jgi:hypothetical protein
VSDAGAFYVGELPGGLEDDEKVALVATLLQHRLLRLASQAALPGVPSERGCGEAARAFLTHQLFYIATHNCLLRRTKHAMLGPGPDR